MPVSNCNDMGRGNCSLHCIQEKEGHAADFLVSQNRKPMLLIETKTDDDRPSPNLIRFQKAPGVAAARLRGRGGPGGKCVCPRCGVVAAHGRGVPCARLMCPKCGAPMSRA